MFVKTAQGYVNTDQILYATVGFESAMLYFAHRPVPLKVVGEADQKVINDLAKLPDFLALNGFIVNLKNVVRLEADRRSPRLTMAARDLVLTVHGEDDIARLREYLRGPKEPVELEVKPEAETPTEVQTPPIELETQPIEEPKKGKGKGK
jgi:hypothetical protein